MNSTQPPVPPLKILMTHFKWTIERFEEILQNEKTDYYRDAAIQRFTFTCDMALKCIQSLAVEQGNSCETFEQGIKWVDGENWFGKDIQWEALVQSFILAAHKQNDESADNEYEKLNVHCTLLKNIYNKMEAM